MKWLVGLQIVLTYFIWMNYLDIQDLQGHEPFDPVSYFNDYFNPPDK